MPRHSLKLLILLTPFLVAPTSASSNAPRITPTPAVISWSDDSSVSCPYERARLAAERGAASQGPTTITLTERVPADAPLLGRGSAFINP